MNLNVTTWEITAITGVVLLYFLLAVFRTAHVELSRLRIHSVVGESDLPGHFLRKWGSRRDRERLLLSVQVAFQSILIITALLVADIVERVWPEVTAPVRIISAFVGTGFTLVLLIRTVVARLIVSLAPRWAIAVGAPAAGATAFVLLPVILPIDALTRSVARRVHGIPDLAADDATEQEVLAFVSMGEEEGILEEDEGDLVRNVVDFGDTIVREIMRPRTEMVALEQGCSLESVRDRFITTRHSRIPVLGESVDEVQGVLNLKDLLGIWCEPGDTSVQDLVRPAMFVPETKRVKDLLREMQVARVQFAVVVDEYGGTAGLVTIEDMVEEIVGEIQDEHEDVEDEVVQEDEHAWLVSGLADVDEVARTVGLEVDAEDFDTAGGLVTALLGRLPRRGESFDHQGVRIEIVDADDKRVLKMRLRRSPAVEPTGQDPA